MTSAQVGMEVLHRRYVPYSHAHYAGNLVDGAYSLAAFGDVATEMCIRTDGDEGLFCAYDNVEFLAPQPETGAPRRQATGPESAIRGRPAAPRSST